MLYLLRSLKVWVEKYKLLKKNIWGDVKGGKYKKSGAGKGI